MAGDTARIRAAFIERQLQRAEQLAAAAKSDGTERGRAARDHAAYIVNEFRRYCEWCRDMLPEADRCQFDRTLRKVESSIGQNLH
jgi:hypothetical protein